MATDNTPFQSIIQNAISSAICIDDIYVTPYETPEEGDNHDDSRQLYESFRKEGNCDLDIYKYKTLKEFEERRKYLFGNKDLLILDWELSKSAPKYSETLSILKQAIETDNIQFITIYTQEEDTENIALKIYSHFKFSNKTKKDIYVSLSDTSIVNNHFEEISIIENILKKNIKGYVVNPQKRVEIEKNIINQIKEIIPSALTDDLKDNIPDIYSTNYNRDRLFGFYCKEIKERLNSLSLNPKDIFGWLESYYYSEMDNDSNFKDLEIISIDGFKFHSILIESTLITIIGKANDTGESGGESCIKPEQLYKTICGIIENIPNKFSALISLELKHFYKKNISSFGKGFMGIDESALLHHAKTYDKATQSEEFYNFILSCWNTQITYKMKEELQALKLLSPQIESFDKIPENNHLSKLIGFLTFSPNLSTKNRKIKFGDVFQLDEAIASYSSEEEQDIVNFKYLICITQECDCLRPHKINNNFVFAVGRIVPSIDTALKYVERDHFTFIDDKTVIQWELKFFSITLKGSNDFKSNESIPFQIYEKSINTNFIGNQKGEFTQRLANAVYSNAMRVGLDLPHLN